MEQSNCNQIQRAQESLRSLAQKSRAAAELMKRI